MSFVSFEKVSKSFGEKSVLKELSFSIEKGQVVCIMGPSGCGKTTVVNLLLGLIKPDSGTINAPEKVSVVFQEDRLFEEFSALSNVAAVVPKTESKDKCVAILEAMDLGSELKTPVAKLSGGMQRRVAIARALVTEADFFILDEPFKGLDENTKDDVIEFVRGYLRGKTILLITHQTDEAEKLGADMVYMEKDGRIKP